MSVLGISRNTSRLVDLDCCDNTRYNDVIYHASVYNLSFERVLDQGIFSFLHGLRDSIDVESSLILDFGNTAKKKCVCRSVLNYNITDTCYILGS